MSFAELSAAVQAEGQSTDAKNSLRFFKQQELLVKYAKDICTKEEANKVEYASVFDRTLKLFYTFLWAPLCTFWYIKYSKDKVNNKKFLYRIYSNQVF